MKCLGKGNDHEGERQIYMRGGRLSSFPPFLRGSACGGNSAPKLAMESKTAGVWVRSDSIQARSSVVILTGACSGAHSGNCFLRACFSVMNVYESNPDVEGTNRGSSVRIMWGP